MHGSRSCLVMACLVIAACSGEGSNESNRNLNGADAGGQTDAGEVEVDASEPDAGEPLGELDAAPPVEDAAVDAAPDASDAAVAEFSITVRQGDRALVDVPVWFHDATGAVLSVRRTGADGRVTDPSTPVMVTAFPTTTDSEGGNSSPQPFTFTAIVPGDQLVLELPAQAPTAADRPGYQLSFAQAEEVSPYRAGSAGRNGCANNDFGYAPGSTLTMPWPAGCPVAQSNSILLTSYPEGTGDNYYAFAKGLPPFGAEPQPATLGAWSIGSPVQLSFSNLPVDQQADAHLGLWSEGVRFDPNGGQGDLQPTTDAARSITYPTPAGFAEQIDVLLNVSGPLTGQSSTMVVRQAPAATVAVDFGTRLLGTQSGTITNAVDARASFSWVNEENAGGADGTLVGLSGYVLNPDGETSTYFTWLVLTPSDTTSLVLPALPAGFEELPAPVFYGATVSHFDSSLDDGYRAVLRNPVRPLPNNSTHPIAIELPAAGTVRIITWRQFQG